MRIGLVSFRCENGNISFNLGQIERAMAEAQGKAELLCFGEAFLQGFDSLCWDYEIDKAMAVERSAALIRRLCRLTARYGIALLVGYYEKERARIYSSCAVMADGEMVHNYRRISEGWKARSKADAHFCEGTETGDFRLFGKKMRIALCGDLWECPERFQTEQLLIWPVYVNFTPRAWENGLLYDYAAEAFLAAPDTLLINSLDTKPVNHGGAFRFQHGQVTERIPFDREAILLVDV